MLAYRAEACRFNPYRMQTAASAHDRDGNHHPAQGDPGTTHGPSSGSTS